MRKVKNISGADYTLPNNEIIENNEIYTILDADLMIFAEDSDFLADINTDVSIYDDDTLISDLNAAINFLKDFHPQDDDGVPFVKTKPFSDPDSLRFRATGIKGTATKAVDASTPTETNIDYKMPEDRYFSGIEFILENHVFGDSLKLQVIDIDNILGYGANFIVDEFGTNWNIASDQQRQGPYILNYCTKVYTNLYLRVVYKAHGTVNDVSVNTNFFLHKKFA